MCLAAEFDQIRNPFTSLLWLISLPVSGANPKDFIMAEQPKVAAVSISVDSPWSGAWHPCSRPVFHACGLFVQIEDPSSPDLVTYIMENEDHTLGNALRYILMRSKDTSFCGYSVPHPTESRINIRLQTTGKPAHDVMKEGIETLTAVGDAMSSSFEAALAKFDAEKGK